MERIKKYKSVPGFAEYGWRDNPALFLKTAPLEIENLKSYIQYLEDRQKRYQYNDLILGEHDLRIDVHNDLRAYYKIEKFQNQILEIQKDLNKLHHKGLHKVLQRRLEFR